MDLHPQCHHMNLMERKVTSEFGSNTSLKINQAQTGDHQIIFPKMVIWKEYSTSYIQSHQKSPFIPHFPQFSTSSASCESPKGIYFTLGNTQVY